MNKELIIKEFLEKGNQTWPMFLLTMCKKYQVEDRAQATKTIKEWLAEAEEEGLI